MSAQFVPPSYVDRNNLDIIEQLVARKNMFTQESKLTVLTFRQESAVAINLAHAPFFLFSDDVLEKAGNRGEENEGNEEEFYDDDAEPEEQESIEEDRDEDKRQTHFRHCKMTAADFHKAVACYTLFSGTVLSFASFYCTDLRRARFEKCNLTGADFEDADLEETSFCLDDSSILNASFKGARNMDKASFYVIRDGYRLPVYQVGVNAEGRLAPDKHAKLPANFNAGAEHGIRFASIYNPLKEQAAENARLIVAALQEAKASGNITDFTPAMKKFLDAHSAAAAAPQGGKRQPV